MTLQTEPAEIRRLRKQNMILAAVSAAVFFFLTNGYRFFNPLLNGDSIMMLYQNDAAWQVALGRFVQMPLILLRGGFTAPFLISILAMLWISLAAAVAADVLRLKQRRSLVLTGAVLACCPSVITLGSGYLPWLDFFSLALFLAVFSVWLITEGGRIKTAGGILCLMLSIGIYQAYLGAMIALVMIRMLLRTFTSDPHEWNRDALRYILSAACAAVLWYVCWRGLQAAFGVWTADTYNGLASVGDFSEVSVLQAAGLAYGSFFDYFLHPARMVTYTFRGTDMSMLWEILLKVCHALLALALAYALYRLFRRDGAKAGEGRTLFSVYRVLILVLFPFGANIVCFFSRGMEHTLMQHALQFAYVLVIALCEAADEPEGTPSATAETQRAPGTRLAGVLPVLLFLPLLWNSFVFSIQTYLKKDLQERAMQSLMTRIVASVESMEGYVPGETAVGIAGSFEMNPYFDGPAHMEDIAPLGTGKTVLAYFGPDEIWLSFFESAQIPFVRPDESREEICSMPLYPAKGSVAWVDGMIVVKISGERNAVEQ